MWAIPDHGVYLRAQVPALSKAAANGDVAAQSRLANWYFYGIGGLGKKENFLKYARMAAEQGDGHAQVLLGYYYINTAHEYEEGLKWARLSAQQGWPRGERFLGYLYSNGIGVRTDHLQAIEWWQKAALHGDDGAALNLGRYYAFGTGVRQNDREAMKWFDLAAENGSTAAKFLTIIYFFKSLDSEQGGIAD